MQVNCAGHDAEFIAKFNSILAEEYTSFDVPFTALFSNVRGLLSDKSNGKKITSILTVLNQYRKVRNQYLTFIQIGANTGSEDSMGNDKIQRLMFANDHWVGIAFEPVQPLYVEFSRNIANLRSRIEPIQAAVNGDAVAGDQQSQYIEIWYVDSARYNLDHPHVSEAYRLPAFINEVASLDKNVVLENIGKKLIAKVAPYVVATQVPLYTPAEVTRRMDTFIRTAVVPGYTYAGGVDVLAVDVEGRDVYVLYALLREHTFRPLIIIFEIKHITSSEDRIAVIRKLRTVNYSCMYSIHFTYQRQAADVLCVLLSSEKTDIDDAVAAQEKYEKMGDAKESTAFFHRSKSASPSSSTHSRTSTNDISTSNSSIGGTRENAKPLRTRGGKSIRHRVEGGSTKGRGQGRGRGKK